MIFRAFLLYVVIFPTNKEENSASVGKITNYLLLFYGNSSFANAPQFIVYCLSLFLLLFASHRVYSHLSGNSLSHFTQHAVWPLYILRRHLGTLNIHTDTDKTLILVPGDPLTFLYFTQCNYTLFCKRVSQLHLYRGGRKRCSDI